MKNSISGLPVIPARDNVPNKATDVARWFRFGSAAWRGRRRCPVCGYLFTDLKFSRRDRIVLRPEENPAEPSGEEGLALAYRCPRCRKSMGGGLELRGDEAERTLKRVLAYQHFAGASERRVRSATRLIQEVGRPDELSRILVKDGKRLGELKRTGAIALEIAANERSEQRLLELEVAELEAQWRREEELASIVDGELTPLPLLETIRRRVTGQ